MKGDFKSIGAAPDFQVKRNWPVERLWRVAVLRSEKNRPELPLLSVFLNRGVIAYGEGGGQVHKPGKDLAVYQVVHQGDFVLNNQQAWRGSVGVSKYHGIISPAYVVLSLKNTLIPRFADYLFQSRVMVPQYVTASKGVGDIQRDIHMPWLKNVRVPLPPPDEQAAIVRFLDHANGKIERAIRAKRKLIALLNEQKQAIIHRAVTRGLDPAVKLKPSGIPWLGDVPEHWEVKRAKYVFREVDERSKTGEEELLSVSHTTGVTPRSEKNITMFKAASYVGYKLCRPDDLVINTMWAWMAALGSSSRVGIVSSGYGVYRPIRPQVIHGRYIEALLHTPHYKADILFRSTGIRASRLRLYPEEFLKMPLTLPPFEEQVAMFQWSDGETKHLSSAIDRTEREIELLREYRTTLTAEVVTGKLDVREAVKRLPAEVEEPVIAEDDSDEIDESEVDLE